MTTAPILPGSTVRGPALPEPIEVLAVQSFGSSLKVVGRGLTTGLTHDPILSPAQIADLDISAEQHPFDGDARLFRLGLEAHRLGLAYEYDPFFSLSIARVDPLPHQLEAVYGYFMRLPRIRFLLADDPGAGKTIMAGLLLKELKARDLELRKIDRVEREAWAAWERSQQPAQSAHIHDETHARKTRRQVKNQYGNPRFLEQVNRCIASRCALLGLGTARPEDGSDGFTFDERRDRIVTVALALRDRAGAAPAGEGLGGDQPRLVCADRQPRTVDAGPPPQLP